MDSLRNTLQELFGFVDISPQTLEALVREGFTPSKVRLLSYEDWHELVSDKIVPLTRSQLFDIRHILSRDGDPSLSEQIRGQVRELVFKLVPSLSEQIRGQVRELVFKLVDIASGEAVFLGTFTMITREGVGVTALHCVNRGGQILEDGLRVLCGNNPHCVKHIVSYPMYDISFYCLESLPTAPFRCLQLGTIPAKLSPGKSIWLASFFTNDSQEDAYELKGPDFIQGQIIRQKRIHYMESSYISFPGCSGGMVLSSDGCVLGMHVGKDYYEDHSVLRPNVGEEVTRDVAIKNLVFGCPETDKFEGLDTDELAHFSSCNVEHKDSLGLFISAILIDTKLMEEGQKKQLRKIRSTPLRSFKSERLKVQTNTAP